MLSLYYNLTLVSSGRCRYLLRLQELKKLQQELEERRQKQQQEQKELDRPVAANSREPLLPSNTFLVDYASPEMCVFPGATRVSAVPASR